MTHDPDDQKWLITMKFHVPSRFKPGAESAIATILQHELEKVDGVQDVNVTVPRFTDAYYTVFCRRHCSYSLAVVSTPREVVEGGQRNDLPLTNADMFSITVTEDFSD
jgi:hypothetical protein